MVDYFLRSIKSIIQAWEIKNINKPHLYLNSIKQSVCSIKLNEWSITCKDDRILKVEPTPNVACTLVWVTGKVLHHLWKDKLIALVFHANTLCDWWKRLENTDMNANNSHTSLNKAQDTSKQTKTSSINRALFTMYEIQFSA